MRCKEFNILFIDICKNAGSSISRGFRKNFPKVSAKGRHHSVRNFTAEGFDPEDGSPWNATCDPVTEEDLETYRTFAVVRNPYDRLVSLYLWGGYKKHSFELFIKKIKNEEYTEFNKHRYRTQLEWISDYNNDIRVQKLLRYENLDEDFYNLLKEWDIPQFKLEKENSAEFQTGKKREHYRHYYNPVSKKIAEELYKEDLKYFNYEF